MDDLPQIVADFLTAAGQFAPPVDVYALLAFLGIRLRRTTELPDEIGGFLVRGLMYEYCVLNMNHCHHRRRFTLAHEVAHTLLGHAGHVIYSLTREETRWSREEAEAYRAAAEILMPTYWVGRLWEECDQRFSVVQSRFDVSRVALDHRVRDVLGILPPSCR